MHLKPAYQQGCQIKRSGGASAVKEPGHYEVRKSSSQVFLVVALKTQAANAVSPSKQNK